MIWGTKGPEYSSKASVYLIVIIIIIICQKCLFANSIYMTNISYNVSNMGCFSQKIKKKNFFLGGIKTDMPETELETLFEHGLKCK